MQLFYLENPEKEIILSAEESKHATKVLRKKEGDILNFTDGKGAFYKAEITVAELLVNEDVPPLPPGVELAVVCATPPAPI